MIAQISLFLLNPWSAITYFGATDCSGLTGNDCSTGLPKPGGGDVGGNQLQDILKIAFAILAALSVLFIVMAGLRFITAQGNPQEVSKAKSTIVYALIGLLVALLAEALVAFVLGKLS
jgi:hypothetical protein